MQLFAVYAAATLLSGAAYAQNRSPNWSGDQGSSQGQHLYRANRLIGSQARGSDGQNLGTIQDVAFNQDGQIFAVVNLGNNRYAPVPWQLLNAPTGGGAGGSGAVTVNTTKQDLLSGPIFQGQQWQNLRDPSFTQKVYAHYNLQPGATGLGGTAMGASGRQGQGEGSMEENFGNARELNRATRDNPQALNVALQQISTQTGVPLEQIRAQHQRHPEMGASGLVFANVLAAETKKSPESFLQERQSGKSWQDIAQENNVPFDRLNTRLDRVWNSVAPTAGNNQ